MIPEEKPVWGTEITREMVDPGYGNMWSVGLKHYKCKEDSSGSYIIHDGRLRAGYARVTTWQGVEWRKTTKNTLQYFEDEADCRLLLVSMQVSIIILILRAESPIIILLHWYQQ